MVIVEINLSCPSLFFIDQHVQNSNFFYFFFTKIFLCARNHWDYRRENQRNKQVYHMTCGKGMLQNLSPKIAQYFIIASNILHSWYEEHHSSEQ